MTLWKNSIFINMNNANLLIQNQNIYLNYLYYFIYNYFKDIFLTRYYYKLLSLKILSYQRNKKAYLRWQKILKFHPYFAYLILSEEKLNGKKQTNKGIDSTLSAVIYSISLNMTYFLNSIGLMGLVMNITSDCLNFVSSIFTKFIYGFIFFYSE